MKTLTKYAFVSCIAALFIVSTEASANFKQTDQSARQKSGKIAIVDVRCVPLPYTGEQLVSKRDSLMNFDIEWILRGSLPYTIQNNKYVDTVYFFGDDVPTSLVCIYYITPVLQYNFY